MLNPVKAERALLLALLVGACATGASTQPGEDAGAVRIERLDPRLDRLVPPGSRATKVAGGFEWIEGPMWDVETGSVLCSDVPRNVIRQWNPAGGPSTFLERSGCSGSCPGRSTGSNGLAFDQEHRLIICQHGDRRIVRREHDGRITMLADRYLGKRLNSPNDVVVRPNGDIWFTDPAYGLPHGNQDRARELNFQGVFRLRPDGTLTAMITDLEAPNGLGFSPGGETLYISESGGTRPGWLAYPINDDGTIGTARLFAIGTRSANEGPPDGLEVDRDGNIWATGPGGIHVFAPDGTRLGRILTGRRAANLAFGEDGSVLYIAADQDLLRLTTGARGEVAPGRARETQTGR